LALVAVVAAAMLLRHRRNRNRLYATLAGHQPTTPRDREILFAGGEEPPAAETCAALFSVDRLVQVPGFVSPATLAHLRAEALAAIPLMEQTYIPLHKKGNTLSYENILQHAPYCSNFYHHPSLQRWISKVTGSPILPTPVQDQSSLSILCYRAAGDHINWHYDHNFYRGRHFTVLLALVNRSARGELSDSRLERQLSDGRIQTIDTPANSLIVFEGAFVRHRATPAAEGDLRIVLSMTYCANPRINTVSELARRIKDTAFYGIRALWD
jgi:hypothetical protein